MRSTTNLVASLISGSTLPAAQINDLSSYLASVDDDALYDLGRLDPPAAASDTNVAVGYIPLYDSIFVEGDVAARQVTIKPCRVFRSSTSNATPRAVLSAVSSADVIKALPAEPPVGEWGIELLYAQISYVSAAEPTKGTQVAFHWADGVNAPAYVSTASAPNFATLPANTATTWNVPLRYVKNVQGAATTPQEYVLHAIETNSYNALGRIRHALGGLGVRRALSFLNQAPQMLVVGSGGVYAGTLTSTLTPVVAPPGDIESQLLQIKLLPSVTDGTAGVDETVEVDNTRDWRNADFLSFWSIPNTTGEYFGEEDQTTGTAATRQHPRSNAGSPRPAIAIVSGQSFEQLGGAGDLVAARIIRDSYSYANGGTTYLGDAADMLSLIVDGATGELQFKRNIAGAIAGAPITIWLLAIFPNKR